MGPERFLLVRLGSLGDIVHALPAASALRDSFPGAQIDWVVDRRWLPLLVGNPDLTRIVELDRRRRFAYLACVRRLREARYSCAIDFQALYKSAGLPYLARIPRRLGFDRRYAREGAASLLYTETLHPDGAHKVEHNLALVERAGARRGALRFSLSVTPEAEAWIAGELRQRAIADFFLLSPGGGWGSKCWPPERFGELHRRLARHTGWRGVVCFAPEEALLAEAVCRAAGDPPPERIPMDVAQLMALVRRARIVVAGDSGTLHLAVALGTPAVGLFGPTDPARNGPFPAGEPVIRNVGAEATSYRRSDVYSAAMLSITVDQVLEAVCLRLGAA